MGKTTQPTLAAFVKRAAPAAAAAPPAAPAAAATAAAPKPATKEAPPLADAAAGEPAGGADALPGGGRPNSSDQKPPQPAAASSSPARAAKKAKVEEGNEEQPPPPPKKEEEGDAEMPAPPPPAAPEPPPPAAAKKKSGSSKKAQAQAPVDPAYAFDEADRAEFRARLLDWYDRGHRVLPWRRNPFSRLPAATADVAGAAAATAATPTPTPAPPESELPPQHFAYRVWVSEIMLQQTQVATVVPYFERWVARWPTVAALAAATEEEVNSLWAGLGYYRRARFLLSGARHVVDNLSGLFPETAEGMRAIPGVGPYTAAAVASIAFGDAAVPSAAAVDGNVIRVVSRLRAVKGDPTKLSALHASLAGQLLDRERPGCHNQAMMELGATVCRPQQAECGACPVAAFCEARRAVAAFEEEEGGKAGGGLQRPPPPPVTAYPEKAAKAAKREQAVAVCVLRLVREGGGEGDDEREANNKAPLPAAKQRGSLAGFVRSSATGGATAAGGEAAALSAAGPAGTAYLLVQRPAQGLLAGLWECPAVVLSDGAGGGVANGGSAAAGAPVPPPSRGARRAAVDGLLGRLLGEPYRRAVADAAAAAAATAEAGGEQAAAAAAAPSPPPPSSSLRLVCRRDLGSAVHIFSHIRQTMHVEVLTLAVRQTAAAKEEKEGDGGFAGAVASLFENSGEGGAPDAAETAAPHSRPKSNKRPAAGSETQTQDDDDDEDDDEATVSDEGAARPSAAAAAPSALRWVGGGALADTGLTTGVRKALAMAAALGGGGGADGKKKQQGGKK